MAIRYKSQVRAFPAAESGVANAHFASKLSFETDPADLHFDMEHDLVDFVVLDTRSTSDYNAGHIPGAVHIPHAQITQSRIEADYPPDTLFVVYCWGPACNASTKGAIRLSALGYAVKELIGGIEYWQKEGYAIEQSS